ncbi:MAG: FAD-binding oxidoreductase [Porticoccaceae bacterium]|nr:FAD-binding oxidoreductase [Porticoccaceae bacterium]
MKKFADSFKAIVGDKYVITDRREMAPYGTDRTTLWQPNPSLVVRPNSVEQVQQIVMLAHRHGIPLVPSGGRTGLSGGAVAKDGEVVVTLERMNRILHFSAPDQSVTCEAGVITQRLQQFASEQGLFYPVDFASSGSSQIGGNVATNAGGIRVLRYGGTREQVTGLRVVTGNGDILDLNRGLVKNNCGPDLRHLFIGSEGILGFICEVTVKLQPPPPPQAVMVVAARAITDLLDLFQLARKAFNLSAFEFFSDQALAAVTAHTGQQNPFANSAPCYGLLEFDRPRDDNDIVMFFDECRRRGWMEDAVISQSEGQSRQLWQLRENISESLSRHRPLKHDIALRLEYLPAFIRRIEALLAERFPQLASLWFGHLGDGNIHLNVLQPEGWRDQPFAGMATQVSALVYGLVRESGGSISAEHGIGLLKKPQLASGLPENQMALIALCKAGFDPQAIMNPGKVL